jgi:hypothetical protein
VLEKGDPTFSVENQFQLYCQRVKLKRTKVSETQWRETKRAFYGAVGQFLLMFRDELSELSEDDGVEVMQPLLEETGAFWTAEAN